MRDLPRNREVKRKVQRAVEGDLLNNMERAKKIAR